MVWTLLFVMLITPAKDSPKDPPEEEDLTVQLAKVRRIYVDILTGGDAALQFRDLLMTSLQSSRLFIITEDEDRADAVIKGAADDQVFTDQFSSTEGINVHTQAGGSSNGATGGLTNATRNSSGSSHSLGLSIGENESRRTEERKHEAIATVCLVNQDGDVLWSATAESFGGKFLGASADVADKIAKRLAADYKAAKSGGAPEPAKPKAPTIGVQVQRP